MSIRFDENKKTFTLETAHAAYQMMVDRDGFLLHLHFGDKLGGGSCAGLLDTGYMDFSPAPDIEGTYPNYTLDLLPQEYPVFGAGD